MNTSSKFPVSPAPAVAKSSIIRDHDVELLEDIKEATAVSKAKKSDSRKVDLQKIQSSAYEAQTLFWEINKRLVKLDKLYEDLVESGRDIKDSIAGDTLIAVQQDEKEANYMRRELTRMAGHLSYFQARLHHLDA